MTVERLIEVLKTVPGNLEVIFDDIECGHQQVVSKAVEKRLKSVSNKRLVCVL